MQKDYNKTEFEKVKELANEGHADAQNALGYMYCNGEGVAQDYKEAVKWFMKAAEQGYAPAPFNLGICYENGNGVEKDPKEAFKWYKKAAELGYAPAQSQIGWCYSLGTTVEQDDKEAFKWFMKAAEQGDSYALYKLGESYECGMGVEQDYEEAFKWYKKAAEQGNADAQCEVGMWYVSGASVEQDYEEAFKWFTKAAGQGNAEGQCHLGDCYLKGSGVPQNYKEAIKWYMKAAEQGEADGHSGLGLCYYNLGCYDDALAHVNLALEQNASLYFESDLKALILDAMGKSQEAIAEIDRFMEENSEYLEAFPEAYYRRGWLKRYCGDINGAIEDYSSAITLRPEYDRAIYERAILYRLKGENALAEEDFRNVVQLDRIHEDNNILQFAYFYMGDREKAKKLQERLIAEHANNKEHIYDAACFYSVIGETEKSLEYLRKSLKLGVRWFSHIRRDRDLEKIRSTEEFEALMNEYEHQELMIL